MALVAAICSLATAVSAGAAANPDDPTQVPTGYNAPANDGLGISSGLVKHVWVIVLENQAYQASFTGLNNNTYLWQTLPSQGALLTNYYGTGHSSLDNYTALVSGQAPISDLQNDADSYTNLSGSIDTSGSLSTNPNYGQFASAAGANAPHGDNGSVYPSSVSTLFNQLDSAHKSWKVYAQDIDATAVANQNAGVASCGAPDATPGATPSSSQASDPGTAAATKVVGGSQPGDQYVAKHNPLPWFSSMLNSGECDSAHLAPVFGPNDALTDDLKDESSTPDFNFIVPDNCNNAHDAVCKGNNLSGLPAVDPNNPTTKGTIPAATNSDGGLYAADLFLSHVIPTIEASPAFKDGGLIDVTFDEAYPPFNWFSGHSADSNLIPPTAAGSYIGDSAGETLFGRSLNWEPTGPNVPISTSQVGQVLTPGPGFNENYDRPGTSATAPLVPCDNGTKAANGWVTPDKCIQGGGNELGSGFSPAASRTDTGSWSTSSSTISDPKAVLTDEGRPVTLAGDPATYYVGKVTDSENAPSSITSSSGSEFTGSFTLVDSSGNPVDPATSGNSASITLGAETPENDRLYDAYDPANGGGQTGDVMISPFIKPGTVSNTYYNHYSTLRSFEDIFGVSSASPGIDNAGHLGYAAQPGLAAFGSDVFTNAPVTPASTVTMTTPGATVTRPGETVTGPGSTITTPGKTITTKALYVTVPRLIGHELATVKLQLSAAHLKLGKVTKPKAKRGYTLVVSKQSLGTGRSEKSGTKVNVTFKYKKLK